VDSPVKLTRSPEILGEPGSPRKVGGESGIKPYGTRARGMRVALECAKRVKQTEAANEGSKKATKGEASMAGNTG